ncbi:MAG: isoleucine--tRNA ligase [Iamia sp.]
MPFGPVDPALDLVALEERVLARWREGDIPARVQEHRAGGEPWIFYEGPPTANGRPGLHHVWARVFKDLYPRFQTMRGRQVPRKGGWDCHGLPVELAVEKELGLSSKQEIEAYGIAAFNERCRASVTRHVEDWTSLTSRSGTWIDTEDAYWTLDNSYVESVWWLVRQMWDADLLYEGHRVTPYCGRCGTALSSHEVAQGYQDVVDRSAYVRLPVIDGPEAVQGADLVVWTTTPWTLISHVAAAVGPDVAYVRVRTGDGADLVMAEAAQQRRHPDAEVVARLTGSDLVGTRYQRPFAVLPLDRDPQVVADGFVTTEDGSGIVHLAPAFGEDDARIGRTEDLPVLNPVDADAAFDDSVPAFTGRFVKDADDDILADLDDRGLLLAAEDHEHSYPHCWRCGTPLIYWAKTSWFARTEARREALLRENERIGWHPDHIKHGRFGKWLESNIDWALSRDRYWGTPLPIWRCPDGHDTCVGSVAELSALSGDDLSALDLHRPFVDDITFPCPECAATARRLPPVLDAWFDSGSMPSAQQHYLGGDEGPAAYPADFICEAIDQTRGWFYSLLAVNTLVFDRTPYDNVVCLGHIVDEQGRKMSKSKGNVIDPWDAFGRFGADGLRWYFFSAGQPWSPRRVFDEAIRESTRQTLITLWNVVGFFTTYADLDGWEPTGDQRPEPTHVLDRWILAQLDATVAAVTEALDRFDALTGASRIAALVDDLSNWYVRRSRPRFWGADEPEAHATLHHCLVVTARLLAPFCPFLAEEIHGILTDDDSVHLADWPSPGPSAAQAAELTEGMAVARRLVALGRAARTDAKVKVRQPLPRALLLHRDGTLTDELRAEVAAELNVKALEEVDTLSGLMTWNVVPNFRALGPRLGPKVPEIKAALAEADGTALRHQLEADGAIEVAGERLTADEVELRAERHESFALAEDGGWAVALDLTVDDALRSEGVARDLIRAVNDLRKEADLALSDRIRLQVEGDAQVADAATTHRVQIASDTLAVDVSVGPVTDGDGVVVRPLELDGSRCVLALTRA